MSVAWPGWRLVPVLAWAAACHRGGAAGTDQPGPLSEEPPEITTLSWGCDVDAATWSFEVTTAGWTGNGYVWMAEDAHTWERHPAYSVEAARDGSADRIALSLDIEADWRDVVVGSSTRFLCGELDELDFVVEVFTPDRSAVADCRWWGEAGLVGVEDGPLPGCDTRLETDEEGGADTGG